MQTARIIVLCVVAAVVCGVIHDQITARLCVEYFTIGHPPLFGTHNPTLLGLGWGVIATWWVGLILGAALAFAARLGRRPRRTVGSLVRPVVQLMLVVGASAACAGVLGRVLASDVPREKHTAYLADLWAHSASYLFGILGGLAVSARLGVAKAFTGRAA